MKLFVWNDVYHVRYGGACAYAVAETEEQARELVRNAPVSKYGYEPREKAQSNLDLDRPADRVMDLPCAEIYEWEE